MSAHCSARKLHVLVRSARLLRHLLVLGPVQLPDRRGDPAGAVDVGEHRPEGGHSGGQQGGPGPQPDGDLRW